MRQRIPGICLIAGVITLVTVGSTARGAEPKQGLSVTFESLGSTRPEPDTRPARLLALHVPQGAPPTPFLPPGRFKATWAGDLNLRLRERMSFASEGRGRLTIAVKGK